MEDVWGRTMIVVLYPLLRIEDVEERVITMIVIRTGLSLWCGLWDAKSERKKAVRGMD
jgi:hypothetical protein